MQIVMREITISINLCKREIEMKTILITEFGSETAMIFKPHLLFINKSTNTKRH